MHSTLGKVERENEKKVAGGLLLVSLLVFYDIFAYFFVFLFRFLGSTLGKVEREKYCIVILLRYAFHLGKGGTRKVVVVT